MPIERDELREELLAILQARQELSSNEEGHLVEGFLTKFDSEIDARIDRRVQDRLSTMPAGGPNRPALAIVASLLLAIPLTAIAGDVAGFPGIVVVWASILAIIYLVTR